MTYILLTIMNLKIIVMIITVMRWNSRKKIEYPCRASFLDLSIEVHDTKCTTELFGKRDAFPFYINYMPHFDSNIPFRIFYASIGSEILLTPRIKTDLINMVK